ncbi:olfactory receptor 9Q2 [Fukomys damarensis]|uniref:Olfactory receptor n=1 Tax=Fukomys damarensis TaxID=885580 RepID=A0A091CTG2_FUKDA|nr:olfactory receptor 9Q2 [Fukomys damarensis]KFO21687.1 Olfactory receptor 9Q2 [Fukomys damarensis]
MAGRNRTSVTEFFLTAFTQRPERELPLFLLFLSFYLTTLLGNAGMIILIRGDLRLHTPMYFFLSHLSFVDMCYSSIIVPQMLVVLWEQGAAISQARCAAQFFLFTFFASIDCYLLAIMAYDRYVPVCQPLLYVTIVTERTRVGLVTGAYVAGFTSAFIRTVTAFTLSFCGGNEIDFIFCDLPPLLKLTCGDSYTQEVVIIMFAIFVMPTCIVVILVSYLFIVLAILRIRSAGGRTKTFSTCASHLTAVALFFGTLIFMYLRDNSGQSSEGDRVVSVLYTVVTPMLNPFIYSLRNKEVKEAVRKSLSQSMVPGRP